MRADLVSFAGERAHPVENDQDPGRRSVVSEHGADVAWIHLGRVSGEWFGPDPLDCLPRPEPRLVPLILHPATISCGCCDSSPSGEGRFDAERRAGDNSAP